MFRFTPMERPLLWDGLPAASPWQPLDYHDVLHAPDVYGVVLVADRHQEPLLVAAGVIREELWRLANDPLGKFHGATYFRFVITEAQAQALALAEALAETADGGHRLFWRHFPSPG